MDYVSVSVGRNSRAEKRLFIHFTNVGKSPYNGPVSMLVTVFGIRISLLTYGEI